jgi:hypothetical protein
MQISGTAGALSLGRVREQLFGRLDADSDGKLALGAFTAQAEALRHADAKAAEPFAAIDTDGSGTIRTSAFEARFEDLQQGLCGLLLGQQAATPVPAASDSALAIDGEAAPSPAARGGERGAGRLERLFAAPHADRDDTVTRDKLEAGPASRHHAGMSLPWAADPAESSTQAGPAGQDLPSRLLAGLRSYLTSRPVDLLPEASRQAALRTAA